MRKPSISFFCPAYHDEKNLPILIEQLVPVLKRHASAFEIVIVVDGDNLTRIVAEKLAHKHSRYIKVIYHNKNQGYGATIKTGFAKAKKYELVCYTDGDCQYDVAEIPRLIKHIDHADVVIGYRTRKDMGISRNVQSAIYNAIVRRLFGLKVRDINCSMKLIRRKALDVTTITSDSSFIDAELLILLTKNKKRLCEVPVSHCPRKYGRASGGNIKIIFKTIKDMIKAKTRTSLSHV